MSASPMDGTITDINALHGLAAVDTRVGYTIFELAATDFEIGDFVSWHPDAPFGRHDITNLSKRQTLPVFFLNHGVPGTLLKTNLQA